MREIEASKLQRRARFIRSKLMRLLVKFLRLLPVALVFVNGPEHVMGEPCGIIAERSTQVFLRFIALAAEVVDLAEQGIRLNVPGIRLNRMRRALLGVTKIFLQSKNLGLQIVER